MQAQQRSDAGVVTPFGRAPLSFADIVERVKPAVVSIQVSGGRPKWRKQRAASGRGDRTDECDRDRQGRGKDSFPTSPTITL